MIHTVREIFPAIVVDNEDPERRGRLKVACAALMGVDGSGTAREWPDWVEASFASLETDGRDALSGGLFWFPNAGTIVELEITTSSSVDQVPGQSSITNPAPRWRFCRIEKADSLPGDITTNYPYRKGFVTHTGHAILLDDSDGDKGQVILKHRQGATITIHNDGKVEIKTSGDVVVSCDGNAEVSAKRDATVKASVKAKVEAPQVELGQGSLDSLIKSTQFETLFATHTHPHPMGPTSPPTPVVWTPAKTTSVKAG